MVDQTNIFEGSSAEQTNEADAKPQAFQIPETASEFIGEGKKYSDVNKALESIPHANNHISKLESELAEIKAKLEASTSVEDALKKLTETKQVQDIPTSQPAETQDIAKLIDQRLMEQEQVKTKTQNIQEVVNSLSQQFGDKDKAAKEFEAKAKELGVGVDYLNDLAATSPKAVFTLFGTGTKTTDTKAMTSSSVNSSSLQSTPNQERPVKSVMSGASTSDVLSAWRAVTANITGD